MPIRSWAPTLSELEGLIRRSNSTQALVQRQIEEEILSLVALPEARLAELDQQWRSEQGLTDDDAVTDWLAERGWQPDDLTLHLARPEALRRFGEQRFGPGLEEEFLRRKNELDQVFYSLLRVKEQGLGRELWIQLSEGEISFAEAASRYSDGPEASTKGVIGPIAMGTLQPELAERLRSLQPGELRPPEALGPWWLLLRLEHYTPARFDAGMRQRLLDDQLTSWLHQRAEHRLCGETAEPLHYDRELEPSS